MFPNASGWLLPKDNLHFSSTLVTAFLFPILFSPDVNTTGYQLVLVGLSHKHGWKVCNMNLPPNSYCSALNLIKRKRRQYELLYLSYFFRREWWRTRRKQELTLIFHCLFRLKVFARDDCVKYFNYSSWLSRLSLNKIYTSLRIIMLTAGQPFSAWCTYIFKETYSSKYVWPFNPFMTEAVSLLSHEL